MTDITNEKPLTTKEHLENALNKLAQRIEQVEKINPGNLIDLRDVKQVVEDIKLAAAYAGDGAIITACNILSEQR